MRKRGREGERREGPKALFGRGLVASALLSRAVSAATRRSGTSASPGVGPEDCPPPVLYDQRWVQLGFLASLALLSDLVCFSVASTPQTWDLVFHQSASNLIDLFLFTNVFSCLAEPWIIRKFGLRAPIVGAGALMAVGCLLRSGLPFTGDLPDYVTVVGGSSTTTTTTTTTNNNNSNNNMYITNDDDNNNNNDNDDDNDI